MPNEDQLILVIRMGSSQLLETEMVVTVYWVQGFLWSNKNTLNFDEWCLHSTEHRLNATEIVQFKMA